MIPTLPIPSLGPKLTVTFNLISTILLAVGYLAIRRRQVLLHRRAMLAALASSAAFLAVYLAHHGLHGSTRYPFHDWTRTAYLVVLIPHSILAAAIVPFILRGVWLALRGRFDRHTPLMRWVWPAWFYVCITGVVVYVMLYVAPHWRIG